MAYNYKLRVKHLVEKADSSNPAIIAEMLGINIRYVDTPNNINGFWKRILRRKFIFVNERLDEWQRMTVISHELGHNCYTLTIIISAAKDVHILLPAGMRTRLTISLYV